MRSKLKIAVLIALGIIAFIFIRATIITIF